jgi:hypothetical protein
MKDPLERVGSVGRGVMDCHPWLGPLDASGYGSTRIDGRKVGAHVAVCEAMHGPVPRGRVVRHLCASVSTKRLGQDERADRACCNHRHLRAGTVAENALDRERVSRGDPRRGRPNPDRRWW